MTVIELKEFLKDLTDDTIVLIKNERREGRLDPAMVRRCSVEKDPLYTYREPKSADAELISAVEFH